MATPLACSISQFREIGLAIENQIARQQVLSALPNQLRTFRPIGREEFMSITGASSFQWKDWCRKLIERGELVGEGIRRFVTLEQVHEFQDLNGSRPTRPQTVPRAIRMAIATYKGGASKSTTTYHLGSRLAMLGYRVLLIDLDGQATLTRFTGRTPAAIEDRDTFAAVTASDAAERLLQGEPVLVPQATQVHGMDIIPANLAVTAMEMEVINRVRDGSLAELPPLFEAALAQVDHNYDFVLMDYQPAFSLTQLFMIYLSDSLFVPVPTEAPDFASTGDFVRLMGDWIGDLEEIFGAKVFDPLLMAHTKAKLSHRVRPTDDEAEQAEIAEQLRQSNAVFAAAGRALGEYRPASLIEDRPVVSKCLASLLSVYEATDEIYDIRSIKQARAQYDALTDEVLRAVNARWVEVAKNGSYDQ